MKLLDDVMAGKVTTGQLRMPWAQKMRDDYLREEEERRQEQERRRAEAEALYEQQVRQREREADAQSETVPTAAEHTQRLFEQETLTGNRNGARAAAAERVNTKLRQEAGRRTLDNMADTMPNRFRQWTQRNTPLATDEENLSRNADYDVYAEKGMSMVPESALERKTWKNGKEFLEKTAQNLSDAATGFGEWIKSNVTGNATEEQPVNKVVYSRGLDRFAAEYPTAVADNALRSTDPNYHRLYRFLNDNEVRDYSYLLAKYGNERADSYLDGLMGSLQARENEALGLYEQAEKTPIVASINSTGKKLFAGAGILDDTVKKATGQKIDPYSDAHLAAQQVAATRGTVTENIDSRWGKLAYGTGMSIADNVVNMAAGVVVGNLFGSAAGTASPLLSESAKGALAVTRDAARAGSQFSLANMAAQAATDGVIDAKARGLSDDQALALGIINGAAEVITEKVSIDALLGDPQGALGYFLKNVVTEGSEEGASSLINLVADVLIAGDRSELISSMNAYEQKGDDHKTAFLKAFGEQAQSMSDDILGGMFSGGVLSAPVTVGTAVNEVRGRRAERVSADVQRSQNADTKQNSANAQGEGADGWMDAFFRVDASKTKETTNDGAFTNPLKPYSDHQIENWANSKNIVVYENAKQADRFVQEAISNTTSNKKLYFGMVTDDVAQRVSSKFGIDIYEYNCCIQQQEIRKILLNSHGNESAENLRGQRAVTAKDIQMIPQVVSNPDEINLSPALYEGKPVIQFVKTINGKTTIVSYVSQKHHDLAVQTMYIGKKGESLATAANAPSTDSSADSPSPFTSETTAGTASSDASISNSAQNVKENSDDWMRRFFRGEQKRGGTETVTDTANTVNAADTNGGDSAFAGNDNVSAEAEWTAENRNRTAGAEDFVSLSEIVSDIRNDFGVTIDKGKVKSGALGIFKTRGEVIRSRVSNDVPTIAHELGHYLDKSFSLRKLDSIQTAVDVLLQSEPEFAAQYQESQLKGEAIAEFVRRYMTDRAQAQADYGAFYTDFTAQLGRDGSGRSESTLQKLDRIADKVNSYAAARPIDRARAAVYSDAEAADMAARSRSAKSVIGEVAEKAERRFVDDYAGIRKAGKDVYVRQYEAVKANVIAEGIVKGDRMVDQNREAAPMRDTNGQVMMDADGKPLREKSLSGVLAPLFERKGRGIAGFAESFKKSERLADEAIKKDFNTYLVCRRGLELPEGVRVFADPTLDNRQSMTQVVAQMEQEHPEFKAVAEDLYRWQRSFLYTWGVQTGLVSQETFDKLGEKYQSYVPLQRHLDEQGGRKSGRGGRSPIKSIRGSGKSILDPLEGITANAYQLVNMAEHNAVLQMIANKADRVDGFGVFAERVRPDMTRTTLTAQAVANMVNRSVTNMAESSADMASILRQAGAQDFIGDLAQGVYGGSFDFSGTARQQRSDIVTVMRRGEATYYQIHNAALLESLTRAGTARADGILKAAASFSRAFKTLVTGQNPVFFLTNMVRDYQTGWRYSSENNLAKYTAQNVKAMVDIIRRSEEYREYKAAGGGYSSFAARNTKSLQSVMNSLYRNRPGVLKYGFTQLLETVEAIGDTIEQAPRFAEYRRSLKGGSTRAAAVLAADESTTNFARGGSWMRQVDAFVPYTNASMQGLYRMGSQIRTHPVPFAVKTGTSAVLTTVLLYAWNAAIGALLGEDEEDEWVKLSQRAKNNNYCFYVGGGNWAKIPKARELGAVQTLLERGVESFITENPDTWKDFGDYLIDCFIPLDPRTIASDTILLGTMTDLKANENYAGSPIVPAAYENLPEKEQYNNNTSCLAYVLGQIFNQSPMQIDYILNDNLGVLAKANSTATVSGFQPDKMGLAASFVADGAYSSNEVNALYDEADEWEKRHNSVHRTAHDMLAYDAYSAAVGTVSAINRYGRGTEEERACKVLARDTAYAFRQEFEGDEALEALYERTGDKDIFPYSSFDTEFTYDGERYHVEPVDVASMWNDYNAAAKSAVSEILESGASDAEKVAAIKKAKSLVQKGVYQKYAGICDGETASDAPVLTNTAGISSGRYAALRADMAAIQKEHAGDGTTGEEQRAYLEKTDLSPAQRAAVYADSGHMNDNSYEKWQGCGLTASQAEQWVYRQSSVAGETDEDGDTITGSKRAEMLRLIQSFCDEFALSSQVKYSLYAACGYKESGVNKVQWFRESDEKADYWKDLWTKKGKE